MIERPYHSLQEPHVSSSSIYVSITTSYDLDAEALPFCIQIHKC